MTVMRRGLQTPEATTAPGAPSFAQFAKGGYHERWRRNSALPHKVGCARVAAHPCKKRKETGALYVKEKLHRKKCFASLLEELEEVPESVIDLLRLSRGALEMFENTQKRLVRELLADPELAERVGRLMTIPAVGEITALTWALEVGDPQRFPSRSDATSYCGLTAALKSSVGKQQRGPISKQRNHWLQTTLIEAAKLAPRWYPQLAALHARELERGHRNRATLAVARKLVTYLLAVDKSRQPFPLRVPLEEPTQKAA